MYGDVLKSGNDKMNGHYTPRREIENIHYLRVSGTTKVKCIMTRIAKER